MVKSALQVQDEVLLDYVRSVLSTGLSACWLCAQGYPFVFFNPRVFHFQEFFQRASFC